LKGHFSARERSRDRKIVMYRKRELKVLGEKERGKLGVSE
jgi:hypothetical protein